MIQPLRKVHRLIFMILAIALPLFFFAGLCARHQMRVQKSPTQKPVAAAPDGATK